MRRARAELVRADLVLLVLDAREPEAPAPALPELAPGASVLRLYNKSDALDAQTLRPRARGARAPARTCGATRCGFPRARGLGLDALRARCANSPAPTCRAGGSFSARAPPPGGARSRASAAAAAEAQLRGGQAELAAEELRRAQAALGEITAPLDAERCSGASSPASALEVAPAGR
jgi:tRNA modification GTPase